MRFSIETFEPVKKVISVPLCERRRSRSRPW